MILAKLSTAITIEFGPVLDADGATYDSAVVADVKICKNNGTPAALNGSATLTLTSLGKYELFLTAADISAVGFATIVLDKTTYIAPPRDLNVLPAQVYNSLVGGTDTLDVTVADGGLSLSSIPWNAAWDAEIESEVTDAILVAGLYLAVGTVDSSTATTVDVGLSMPNSGVNLVGNRLVIRSGTGVYQSRRITAVASTTFTVDIPWTSNPANGDTYSILPGGAADLSNTTVKINSGITKNTALANLEFFMASSSDHLTGKTGLTITAERSIDGGAFAPCTNAAAEVSAGLYKIDLSAADLNGDVVTFKFTGTGADPRLITFRPTP